MDTIFATTFYSGEVTPRVYYFGTIPLTCQIWWAYSAKNPPTTCSTSACHGQGRHQPSPTCVLAHLCFMARLGASPTHPSCPSMAMCCGQAGHHAYPLLCSRHGHASQLGTRLSHTHATDMAHYSRWVHTAHKRYNQKSQSRCVNKKQRPINIMPTRDSHQM